MQKLAEICVRRPVFASVIILSLVVVGLFSMQRLGVDRFPKVDFPWVTITTVQPGAAPEEIETEITDKIEESVNTISGVDQLMSISSEGVSVVTIQFDLEKDPDVASQEVRDRVNTILRDLPRDADPPVIQKIDPDAIPVIAVALSGPAPIREITEYADKTFRRRLESVLGVGQVQLIGGQERQINVVVDTAKLTGLDLTVTDVVQALQAQNIQIPGGRVEQGIRDLTLRTYGRVETPEELGEIPVTSRGGTVVFVKDVARIEDSQAEPETIARVNGKPAVVLQILKQSGTNTIAVVDRVKERLDQLHPTLPKGWDVEIVRDQSNFILAAVHAVQEHLILGAIFAVGIVLLFLRKFHATLISAVAIPTSIIATFGVMYYFGFTLNIITLLALTLAVGIVIDDAVVVLENIFRFMEEKDLTPMQAAVEGTREVGMAVLATSLSLIAVFLPVAFMGGIVGRFMYGFGVTMAAAVAVSLLVSFTLTPMMASRFLTKKDTEDDHSSREKGFYPFVEKSYLTMLGWSMRHRWVIVVVMALVFLSTIPLGMIANKNFLPNDDESQFTINVRAPEGSSLDSTRKILESMASRVNQIPEVETTVVTLASDLQKTRNYGEIYVKLKPAEDRDLDQFDVMSVVRQKVVPLYTRLDLRVQVTLVNAFGGGANSEIMFWIGGPDFEKLDEYSSKLVDVVKKQPGVADVTTNLIVGKPELGVRIEREKAGDVGVRVQDIASTLNLLVGGQKVSDYYEHGDQYEVHVRAEEKYRRDAEGFLQAKIPTTKGESVRLGDVVSVVERSGPAEVNRIARRRQVLIQANMLPGYSSQAVIDALEAEAERLNMGSEYSHGLQGRSREQQKAGVNFLIAFALSIVFMYLILAAQFESWVHPITILLALPMTVPFALLSIVVLNQSINIFSSLGILVLFGIVKKNGILQIDHTNQLREKGMARLDAIMHANRDRLRPILMTTLAFVAGMIPLVVSSGTGAGTNRAIGSVIIGGQMLALLLTLVGVPVVYSIFDDWAESRIFAKAWSKAKGWLPGRKVENAETA
ncbi:MAG: efflux RND transporter permease subunit [Acidobacteria bacterium]|nr:efflux RND transporter permease subunit [Acidobacteriota bacterium]